MQSDRIHFVSAPPFDHGNSSPTINIGSEIASYGTEQLQLNYPRDHLPYATTAIPKSASSQQTWFITPLLARARRLREQLEPAPVCAWRPTDSGLSAKLATLLDTESWRFISIGPGRTPPACGVFSLISPSIRSRQPLRQWADAIWRLRWWQRAMASTPCTTEAPLTSALAQTSFSEPRHRQPALVTLSKNCRLISSQGKSPRASGI